MSKTVAEIAETLGCSRQYVHKLIKRLEIEPKYISPRLISLTPAQVNKILKYAQKK